MNLQKIYTSLLATDLEAAEHWYSKFLGRGPDHRPMPTLAQVRHPDGNLLTLATPPGRPFPAA